MALNLSSDHIQAWRALLPVDLQRTVGDDIKPADDDEVASFVRDIEAIEGHNVPRRLLDVVDRHPNAIRVMGRARRLRLMSWLVNTCWPDTNLVRDLMRDDEVEEGGGGEGRAKVAPLFRSDYEAMAAFCQKRQVRGMQSTETVEAVFVGVREFSGAENSAAGM